MRIQTFFFLNNSYFWEGVAIGWNCYTEDKDTLNTIGNFLILNWVVDSWVLFYHHVS